MFLRTDPKGAVCFHIFPLFPCRGVHGHFNGQRPWAQADECIVDLMAELVGRYELQGKLCLEMETNFFQDGKP